jgi:hypothetical protein
VTTVTGDSGHRRAGAWAARNDRLTPATDVVHRCWAEIIGADAIRRKFHAAIAFALAVMLALVTSCSKGADRSFEYFRVTIDGQQTLGTSAKGAMVRAVVIFFHGVGGNEFSITADDAHTSLTTALVDADFAVFASNAGGDVWGDPASQRNYLQLGGVASQHYGTENIFFVAETMGAIAAANLLSGHAIPRVRGFAAINPVLDLAAVNPEYKPSIEATYPDRSFGAVNPMRLPPDSFRGTKMRFYADPDDQAVPAKDNALPFRQRFGSDSDISIVDCHNRADGPSCFQGDDLVRWFTKLEARS